MGWDFGTAKHYKNGRIDRKAEVRDILTPENSVLKDSMVGSTYYAAIKDKKTGEVFCGVILTRTREGWEFGYKALTEYDGPVEDKCPKSILDLLTPTDNKYALGWRERCRKNYEIKKISDSKKKDPERAKRARILRSVPLGGEIIVTFKNWKGEYQKRYIKDPMFPNEKKAIWKQLYYGDFAWTQNKYLIQKAIKIEVVK